nr:hypothetical protein [Brevibacterium rongguiense]
MSTLPPALSAAQTASNSAASTSRNSESAGVKPNAWSTGESRTSMSWPWMRIRLRVSRPGCASAGTRATTWASGIALVYSSTAARAVPPWNMRNGVSDTIGPSVG